MIPFSDNSWKTLKMFKIHLRSEWLVHIFHMFDYWKIKCFFACPKHILIFLNGFRNASFQSYPQFISLSFKIKFLSSLQWESLLLTSFMIMMTGGSPLISSSEKEQKWDVSRPITALLTVTDDVWEEARESEKNKELTKKNKLD